MGGRSVLVLYWRCHGNFYYEWLEISAWDISHVRVSAEDFYYGLYSNYHHFVFGDALLSIYNMLLCSILFI